MKKYFGDYSHWQANALYAQKYYDLTEYDLNLAWDNADDFTTLLENDLKAHSRSQYRFIHAMFRYNAEGTFWLVNTDWWPMCIHKFCERSGFPIENIYFVTSCNKFEAVYNNWKNLFLPYAKSFNVIAESFGLSIYKRSAIDASNTDYMSSPYTGARTKKMNILNGRMCANRQLFMTSMWNRGLIDTTNNVISFHQLKNTPTYTHIPIPKELADICPVQFDMFPTDDSLYADPDHNPMYNPISDGELDFCKLGNYSNIYRDTYVTVTTEGVDCYSISMQTNNDSLNAYFSKFYEELLITEKITRPMMYYHPQIIFSTNGTLELLRNMGFETFGDYWNENYDNTSVDNKIKIILDNIQMINEMTHQELNDMYAKMIPVLEYNKQHLLDYA